jgi:hypothetical protein
VHPSSFFRPLRGFFRSVLIPRACAQGYILPFRGLLVLCRYPGLELGALLLRPYGTPCRPMKSVSCDKHDSLILEFVQRILRFPLFFPRSFCLRNQPFVGSGFQ